MTGKVGGEESQCPTGLRGGHDCRNGPGGGEWSLGCPPRTASSWCWTRPARTGSPPTAVPADRPGHRTARRAGLRRRPVAAHVQLDPALPRQPVHGPDAVGVRCGGRMRATVARIWPPSGRASSATAPGRFPRPGRPPATRPERSARTRGSARATGSARLFEEFVRGARGARGRRLDARTRLAWWRARHDEGAAAARERVAGWIREARRPFFWFANLMECHSPYLPPRPYDDRARWSDGARCATRPGT